MGARDDFVEDDGGGWRRKGSKSRLISEGGDERGVVGVQGRVVNLHREDIFPRVRLFPGKSEDHWLRGLSRLASRRGQGIEGNLGARIAAETEPSNLLAVQIDNAA